MNEGPKLPEPPLINQKTLTYIVKLCHEPLRSYNWIYSLVTFSPPPATEEYRIHLRKKFYCLFWVNLLVVSCAVGPCWRNGLYWLPFKFVYLFSSTFVCLFFRSGKNCRNLGADPLSLTLWDRAFFIVFTGLPGILMLKIRHIDGLSIDVWNQLWIQTNTPSLLDLLLNMFHYFFSWSRQILHFSIQVTVFNK